MTLLTISNIFKFSITIEYTEISYRELLSALAPTFVLLTRKGQKIARNTVNPHVAYLFHKNLEHIVTDINGAKESKQSRD